ncbi:hypothetical protein [Actinoplanes sp. GCM10030250]|uniref:hypothetical protein n=1 Tax=Actinoplanes sp. GCM10030250 TaxID=3273376 RepID=UPI0036240CE7
MAPSRLFAHSLGGAFLTSAVAAAWLAPGTAFAATATETLSVDGTVESVIVDPEPGALTSHTEQKQAFVRVNDLLLPVPAGYLSGAESGQRATVQLRVRPGTSRTAALTDAAETMPVPAVSTARALGQSSAAVVAARLTGPVTSNQAAARAQSAETQEAAVGAHRLTVLPVFWSAKDTATQASLTGLANQAKDYWDEQSNGGIDISVDVRDWKQVSAPSGSCNYTAIFQAALAEHAVSAPNRVNEHVAVYFPQQSGCSWAGLGSVNGSMIWINGYPWEDVLTHEFGHNLGLGHANRATCTASGARVPLSSSCTVEQYYDTSDVMGFARQGMASGNLNAAFGDYLGLQQTVTAPASQKTTVDLSALSAHSGTSGLRIATTVGTVFVDFRPAAGRDTRSPGWAGVQVRLRTATNPPTTQLLDMQPGTRTAFSAANLPVNSVWQVPGTSQSVKVTSISPTKATVEVSGVKDTTAPSAAPVIVTAAGPTNAASQTITWTAAADKESGISAYRVMVNGTLAAETDGDTLTADVPLAEGNNSVVVVAVNGSGLVKSSTAKVFPRDSIAPAPVTGLKVSADGKSVTWTAAADKGTARSYAVRIDGALAATVTTTTAKVSITAGQRTVSVTPSDAAGNAGTATEATLWIDPTAPVPPALTSPDGTWQNSRQVSVTWDPASAPGSGIASYTVTAGGKSTTVDGNTTSATMTVPADGTHTVSVVAKNLAGVASKVATAAVKVDTVAPPAATTIKLSADKSKLTWAAATGSGSPVSWRVQADGGAAVAVTKPEAPVTASGGRQTWTITPVDAAGNVGPAVQYTAWTDQTAPSEPAILTPSADSATRTGPVTVTWTAAADGDSGITSYVVTVGTRRTTVPGTATSYSYQPADGRQTVSVAAVNGAGLSSTAASVAYTYDKTAPTAATRVTVSGAGSETVLRWTAATDRTSGVAEYVLSLDGTPVTTVPATATTATVTTPAGRHTWTVTAVDIAGNSSAAASAGALWFDTTAPVAAQPVTLPAVQAARAVKVTWTPAADLESGIRSYVVIASNGIRTIKTTATATATTATVTVPEDGSWAVAVQAVNQAGLTTDAPAGTVLVDSAKPAAPVITSPVAKGTTGTSFTVGWTAPAAGRSGISGYRVEVNGKIVATVDGSTFQAPVSVTAVRPTPVAVKVTALSGAGLAGSAAQVSFTVNPAA